MSSRPLLKPYLVIKNGDMSGSLISIPSLIQMIPVLSYGVVWTGTPTGVFNIQVSNDYSLDETGKVANAGTWATCPVSSATPTLAAAGVADNGFIDVLTTGAYAMRLIYTFTSGVGNLNVTVCGKTT